MTLLIVASLVVAPALAVPALRRRLARAITRARKRLAERARLRLAAALLDLGNHLMLCDEERRARRVRGSIDRSLRRGQDPERALARLGGSWTDEVTFTVPIGLRAQDGDPSRTLDLSCTVCRPPDAGFGSAAGEPTVAWRVTARPSAGRRGPISYSEVPDLERALLSYYAPVPAAPAVGVRAHDGEAKPAA